MSRAPLPAPVSFSILVAASLVAAPATANVGGSNPASVAPAPNVHVWGGSGDLEFRTAWESAGPHSIRILGSGTLGNTDPSIGFSGWVNPLSLAYDGAESYAAELEYLSESEKLVLGQTVYFRNDAGYYGAWTLLDFQQSGGQVTGIGFSTWYQTDGSSNFTLANGLELDPQVIDFGGVAPGDTGEVVLTVTNNTGTSFSQDWEINCQELIYPDTLDAPDGTQTQYVFRYAPTGAHQLECETNIGVHPDISAIPVRGYAETDCLVLPLEPEVRALVGEAGTGSFQIINNGASPRAVDPTLSCGPDWSILEGGGPAVLSPGDSLTVVVQYVPQEPGVEVCEVSFADPPCSPVVVQGLGIGAECTLETPTVDPVSVEFGNSAVPVVQIRNTGTLPLSGAITLDPSQHFELANPVGDFLIQPGWTVLQQVRYEPLDYGLHSTTLWFGPDCPITLNCYASTPPPEFEDDAVIAVHLKGVATKNLCLPENQGGSAPSTELPCLAFDTAGEVGVGYNAYVYIANAWTQYNSQGLTDGGVGGAEFGLDYDGAPGSGVDVFSWVPCGFSFPSATWPEPGSGIRVIWDAETDCQLEKPQGSLAGVRGMAGSMYVYAYGDDVLEIVPHGDPGAASAKISNCFGQEVPIPGEQTAFLAFSAGAVQPGCTPCLGPCGAIVGTPSTTAPRLLLPQNAPNPFRGATRIAFSIPADGPVRVEVFDLAGRRVARPLDAVLPAGGHRIEWDGRSESGRRVAAGIYLYRLTTQQGTVSRKLVALQ